MSQPEIPTPTIAILTGRRRRAKLRTHKFTMVPRLYAGGHPLWMFAKRSFLQSRSAIAKILYEVEMMPLKFLSFRILLSFFALSSSLSAQAWFPGFIGLSNPPMHFPYDSDVPSNLIDPGVSEANINAHRYWNYRNRLRNDFMILSTAQGGCLPAEAILVGGSHKFGRWGDTNIKLGWYLGTLATEIHMLKHPEIFPGFGGPGDLHNATVELFCALVAVERLDKLGEQAMWNDNPVNVAKYLGSAGYQWPDSPGFLVRDDVGEPTGTALGLDGGMSDFSPAWGAGFPIPSPLNASEFRKNREMSQDQAVHILLGLALVKRFVPPDLQYDNVALRGWAIEKADQIVTYIAHGHTSAGDVAGVPIQQHSSWMIEEPVSPEIHWLGHCPVCLGWFDPFHPTDPNHMDLVDRGSDARAFALGFATAGEWISGKHFPVDPPESALWQYVPLDALLSSDNMHMSMALASIGESWGILTSTYLETMAPRNDFYAYPLINAMLRHDGTISPTVDDAIRGMLLAAPYGGPNNSASGGWASQHRFITSKGQHEVSFGLETRFNGLDYTLLHNLYYISRPDLFLNVATTDQPPIPEMTMPDWPTPPTYVLPPIGYGYTGSPNVVNTCQWDSFVDIPITIEWDDPKGNRDSVIIEVDGQPGDIGLVTAVDKNHFLLHGQFWGRWVWESTVRFKLTDQDGNSSYVNVPIAYPGAVRQGPDMGAVGYPSGFHINGWFWGIPLYGTVEFETTVYAIDKNCFPPKPAAWFITGLNNVVAWPTSSNTFHTVAVWTLWTLFGSGTVSLTGVSAEGDITNYDVPINW